MSPEKIGGYLDRRRRGKGSLRPEGTAATVPAYLNCLPGRLATGYPACSSANPSIALGWKGLEGCTARKERDVVAKLAEVGHV